MDKPVKRTDPSGNAYLQIPSIHVDVSGSPDPELEEEEAAIAEAFEERPW